MSKFRVTSDKNLVKIVRKYFGKVPVNEREIDIFEKNIILGVFRPRLEGKHKLVYTAPMSKPLADYMKKGFTVHKLYSVLVQILEITKRIECNGLYLNNLILDKKLIYVREITGELVFLYEPVLSRENGTSVYAFMADLIREIKVPNRELENECEKLRCFFADVNNYRIENLENFIKKVHPQIYQQITTVKKRENGTNSGFIASSKLSYQRHYGQQEKQNNIKKVDEIGETTVLNVPEVGTTLLMDDEEGTVILAETMHSAKIRRVKTSDIIKIYEREFYIGKDVSCQFAIIDNKAVSRIHAAIYYKNGTYIIRDENSTNHTYVNGVMLEAGKEKELQSGDTVRLADENFEFYLD